VCEVWDAAARGGRGASLGRGTLSVPVRSLQHRQQQDAELTWQAGGRAGEVSVQLQLSYMLQVQWPATKLAASVDKEGTADLSTAGGLLLVSSCRERLLCDLALSAESRLLVFHSHGQYVNRFCCCLLQASERCLSAHSLGPGRSSLRLGRTRPRPAQLPASLQEVLAAQASKQYLTLWWLAREV
jgi:hypothetical protein